MWRNYLTVGVRALLKNRTYAFINIFGLALGLAACLIILLFVRYETTYDRWIPGADRAFQLQDSYRAGPLTGGEAMKGQMTSIISRKMLVKDFPQIETSVYAQFAPAIVNQAGEPSGIDHFILADGNLFDILQLPFLKGDPRHALDRPGNLVLTQSEAAKRFPHRDPVGKTLTIKVGDLPPADYRITGIVRDLPGNTHVRLDMVARFDPESFYATKPGFTTSWYNQSGWAYVKLRPGASAETINAQLPAWKKRNIPDQNIGGVSYNAGNDQDWRLVKIRDVHLGEAQLGAMSPGNEQEKVLTFALIALLILGMAVVNFVNLATARASQRAREVALRKVVGASRRQLIFQFLGESILVTALAMLLGLAMTELSLPTVNAFLNTDMAIHYFARDGLLPPILLLVIIVGAAGGLYPAFYLSRFQPAFVLKANKSAADAPGSGRLRNMLVIGQFAVSIGLIICTAVVYAQTLYARTTDAGYRREGLLQIEIHGIVSASQLPTLKQQIENVAGVQGAAPTEIGVNPGYNSMTQLTLPGRADLPLLGDYSVDANFFDVMGMKLLAGRKFDETVALDEISLPSPRDPEAENALIARGANVIITESAARTLGIADPQAAIGRRGSIPMGPADMKMPVSIIGVVKDARFRTIRLSIQPILYTYARTGHAWLMVRYDSAQPKRVMADIEETWRRVLPTVPFKASFVDDRLREMYQDDEARGQMFGAFALLAVVIGCLGLFGLAAFTAERRTKEIGIRKVLGARTRDIVRLLAWQFSKPVIVANLIAWPVAWYVMRDWLNGFDTRIALSPAYFLIAGALALIIAIGTIAGHAFKVAGAKPIRALRYE